MAVWTYFGPVSSKFKQITVFPLNIGYLPIILDECCTI